MSNDVEWGADACDGVGTASGGSADRRVCAVAAGQGGSEEELGAS